MYAFKLLVPFLLALDAMFAAPLGAVIGAFMIVCIGKNDEHDAVVNMFGVVINAIAAMCIEHYLGGWIPRELHGTALMGACRGTLGTNHPAMHVVAIVMLLHKIADYDDRSFCLDMIMILCMNFVPAWFPAAFLLGLARVILDVFYLAVAMVRQVAAMPGRAFALVCRACQTIRSRLAWCRGKPQMVDVGTQTEPPQPQRLTLSDVRVVADCPPVLSEFRPPPSKPATSPPVCPQVRRKAPGAWLRTRITPYFDSVDSIVLDSSSDVESSPKSSREYLRSRWAAWKLGLLPQEAEPASDPASASAAHTDKLDTTTVEEPATVGHTPGDELNTTIVEESTVSPPSQLDTTSVEELPATPPAALDTTPVEEHNPIDLAPVDSTPAAETDTTLVEEPTAGPTDGLDTTAVEETTPVNYTPEAPDTTPVEGHAEGFSDQLDTTPVEELLSTDGLEATAVEETTPVTDTPEAPDTTPVEGHIDSLFDLLDTTTVEETTPVIYTPEAPDTTPVEGHTDSLFDLLATTPVEELPPAAELDTTVVEEHTASVPDQLDTTPVEEPLPTDGLDTTTVEETTSVAPLNTTFVDELLPVGGLDTTTVEETTSVGQLDTTYVEEPYTEEEDPDFVSGQQPAPVFHEQPIVNPDQPDILGQQLVINGSMDGELGTLPSIPAVDDDDATMEDLFAPPEDTNMDLLDPTPEDEEFLRMAEEYLAGNIDLDDDLEQSPTEAIVVDEPAAESTMHVSGFPLHMPPTPSQPETTLTFPHDWELDEEMLDQSALSSLPPTPQPDADMAESSGPLSLPPAPAPEWEVDFDEFSVVFSSLPSTPSPVHRPAAPETQAEGGVDYSPTGRQDTVRVGGPSTHTLSPPETPRSAMSMIEGPSTLSSLPPTPVQPSPMAAPEAQSPSFSSIPKSFLMPCKPKKAPAPLFPIETPKRGGKKMGTEKDISQAAQAAIKQASRQEQTDVWIGDEGYPHKGPSTRQWSMEDAVRLGRTMSAMDQIAARNRPLIRWRHAVVLVLERKRRFDPALRALQKRLRKPPSLFIQKKKKKPAPR
ncbi:hypothetical protein F5Y05DRAFT_416890 [Hypoxylon sp. FL0543]|nr:hypothetical protein F5Y05DRAFT_416890 [Hypoxylon sp. FL0543]